LLQGSIHKTRLRDLASLEKGALLTRMASGQMWLGSFTQKYKISGGQCTQGSALKQ